MPIQPTKKYPEIIDKLKWKGCLERVQRNELEMAIIEVLGLTSKYSVERNIETMEKLGFLEKLREGLWTIKKQD